MANLAIYEKALGLSQCEDILEDFQKTLSETNRNSKFFVDWQKIIHNVENIHIQLNILNAVLCSTTAKEAEETFVKLTKKYPEVIEVLPLLLAIREQKIIVNNDFSDKIPKLEAISISFRQDVVQNEIDFQILIEFLRSAGVFKLFADPKIHDLVEYVFGVEVGLDTHTRKNRSGIIMQFTLEPQLKKLIVLNPKYLSFAVRVPLLQTNFLIFAANGLRGQDVAELNYVVLEDPGQCDTVLVAARLEVLAPGKAPE